MSRIKIPKKAVVFAMTSLSRGRVSKQQAEALFDKASNIVNSSTSISDAIKKAGITSEQVDLASKFLPNLQSMGCMFGIPNISNNEAINALNEIKKNTQNPQTTQVDDELSRFRQLYK